MGQSALKLKEVDCIKHSSFSYVCSIPITNIKAIYRKNLKSSSSIGYRVGFFGEADNPQNVSDRIFRDPDSKVYGPVPNVKVSVNEDVYPGGVAATDDAGKFFLRYFLPYCPVGGFEYQTDVYTEIRYKNFMPIGSATIPYYLRRQEWDFCASEFYPAGFGLGAVLPIDNTTIRLHNSDFYVDVMFLTGKMHLKNIDNQHVPIDAETTYKAFTDEEAPAAAYRYDFNRDQQPDFVVKGKVKALTTNGETVNTFIPEAQFTSGDEVEHQGIYFDQQRFVDGEQPDLIRIADTQKRLTQPVGILETISEDDYKNTEVLVFRDSSGELIVQRKGLRDNEYDARKKIGYDSNEQTASYRIMLRGDKGHRNRPGLSGGGFNYQDYASDHLMAEPFQERKADHPKPGEFVTVVAINRATGYIGTQRVQLKNAADNFGMLSVVVPDITMRPPNLKIWAERSYAVEKGLTQGDSRSYTIGSEGVGLSSDAIIKVYTEWLDHDDSPLPAGLAVGQGKDFGLTGRLAKIVAPNVLQGAAVSSQSGSNLAEFSIAPGRQTQVIKVADNLSQAEHYYVHVSGTQQIEGPSFASGPSNPPYDTRPASLTPFKVPLYFEEKDWLDYQAYRDLQDQFDSGDSQTDPNKPLPAYAWQYRPEYQFSQYQLEMNELARVTNAGETNEERSDILNLTNPTLASSDDYIEALYSLISSNYDRLTPIDGGQDLILALGEEEMRVEIGQNKTIKFENIEHLSSLDPEDFLTMRLYTNQDAGNVLWEYAFDYLALDTRIAGYDNQTDETWYVTADNPTVPFQAVLVGFANRDPASQSPQTIRWSADNIGVMNPVLTTDTDLGVFSSDLTMPTIAGMKAKVKATLVGQSETSAVFKTVEVLPGKPGLLNVTATGEPSAMGLGEMNVSVTVKDNYGNLVLDGTSVSFSIEGDAQISQYDAGTSNGVATATIKGSEIANPTNKLIVSVDALSHEHVFPVHPLNIAVDNFDTTQHVGQDENVSVTVTDYTGAVAPDLNVSFSSTYGTFKDSLITTDANGQASATLINPRSEGNAELNLQIGIAGRVKQAYVVDYPTAQLRDINSLNAMFVADQSSAGYIEHERFDGTNIGLDYKVQKAVRVLGSAGETVNISLGDLQDPNIEPLAAFYMNELDTSTDGSRIAPDEAGLHNANAKYVTVMQQNPMGKGNSYFFNKGNYDLETDSNIDSHLQIAHDSALNQGNNLGFRLDFKADQNDATLFNHHSGTQVLRYNASGEVEYQIQTDTGTYIITSGALPVAQWHTVAGRYYNGQLELEVNGQAITPIPVSGTLQYSGTSGIRIADNYQGFMNSVRFYNWNAQPLTQFPNGQQNMAVTVGGDGYTDVMVTSTGQLNQQQSGSATKLLRVAIKGQLSREYISLLSSNTYQQLASQYMNTLYADAPPINIANLYNTQPDPGMLPLSFIIPTAHAGVLDFTLNDIADGLTAAVSFLGPFESVGILIDQLTYLAKGDPNFSAVELTFAALDLMTFIPIARPFSPLIKPVKRFVKKYGNKPIIKAIAGVLGDATEQAVSKRKYDKFESLLPYLLIVGEILNDPDGLEAIEVMIDSIGSTDDLWAWIEYLNLPEDGWIGTQVPELELTSVQAVRPFMFASFDPLSVLIPKAHAAPLKGKRVSGTKVRKLIKALKKMDDEVFEGGGRQLVDGIKSLTKGMKVTSVAGLRKLVFSPQALTAAVALSGNALKNIMTRSRNFRMSPLAILATVTYLETRKGDCADDPVCKPFINDVPQRINSLYKTAFIQILTGDREFVGNQQQGALFNLAMIAVKHLEYETTNSESRKIVAVQAPYNIQFYTKPRVAVRTYGQPIGRIADIVLSGQGGNNQISDKSELVEVKSLVIEKKSNTDSRPKNNHWQRAWTRWDVSKRDKYSNHREFYLDRVATKNNPLVNTNTQLAAKYEWWLQDFNRVSRRGYTTSELNYAAKKLKVLPSGNRIAEISMGFATEAQHDAVFTETDVRQKVKLFNIKTWLTSTARNYILDGIGEGLISDLITNSDDF